MTIYEKAFAKLNLCLKVGERLGNGYHKIESVMQSCSLSDDIRLEKAEVIKLACSDPSLPSGRDNLAFRAAEVFFDRAGIKGGADIYIEKRIPKAAGLGGGSADAAAVLRGLNRLYERGFSLKELERISAPLGTDVPFCVRGGTCAARGIGDELTALPDIEPLDLVIAVHGEGISTPYMYAQTDMRPNEKAKVDIGLMLKAVGSGRVGDIASAAANSFSLIAARLRPEIPRVIGELKKRAALCACISGTGPSVFAIFQGAQEAKTAAADLNAIGIFAVCCQSVRAFTE